MQTPNEPQALTQSQASSAITPPAPGEYWPGQGGIYAGIARGEPGQPPHHLILAEVAPETKFTWRAGIDFAKLVKVDGHADFDLPTRFESALLYANLQDKFDDNYWYWTGTQCSEYYAYYQNFDDGGQNDNGKKYEGRCRFVRRLALQTFNPLVGEAA